MHRSSLTSLGFSVVVLAAGCGGGGSSVGRACVDDSDCDSGLFCNAAFVCEARPADAGSADAARDGAIADSAMVDTGVPDSGSMDSGARDSGAVCGDGLVDGAELCDDGNTSEDDACLNDCQLACGDGVVNAVESCDTAIAAGTAGACPSACDDGDACTTDSLSGESCTVVCDHGAITAFADGDLCCPPGATSLDDADCAVVCGNGLLEAGEACDTGVAAGSAGACPTVASCADLDACTTESVSGDGSCAATCAHTEITATVAGDLCCPPGASAATDSDCAGACGDGVVTGTETCDTAIAAGASGACPSLASCDDGDSCTTDALRGGGSCNARCAHTAITTPTDGDLCCPAGANETTDADCAPVCGNRVIETGETCDDGDTTPGDGCDASCQREAAAPTAFRMQDLDLRDPHIYVQVPFAGCRDLTDTGVFGAASINQQLEDAIQLDGDMDGLLDLSFALVFRPLSQAAAGGTLDFYSAACSAPAGSSACSPGGATPDTASYTNQTSGTCLGAVPGSVAPYTPAVATPAAPCFVTAPISLSISLSGVLVPLEQAQIAATYLGSPATDLRNGLVRGFLTTAVADATILPSSLPVIGGDPLSSVLAGGRGSCTRRDDRDDLDGDGRPDGWWFYLNFPATEVPWSETP